jgi:8-oxo-dGTP pyrophosphatase MutT (NUDIX family)
MAYDRINVRWIIRDWDKLFLVKSKDRDYRSLPWWWLDKWEKAQTCLKRELYEELWIEADIGDLLFSQEFYNKEYDIYILDLFFNVKLNMWFISWCHCNWSHWFELKDSNWILISKDLFIKPQFLIDELLNPSWKIFFSELSK